ncbi:MAG: hypothetical protein B7X02_01920 [Rhodospirillales bacterium 12-54-5]|nr:MAG: hypothetical protein B7X02_01920 [Rhodospirillales bacterium 12-54-5]
MQPLNKTPQPPARLNEQLEQYWRALKGDRALPREDEVDPDQLKEIWDSCFLVQLRADDVFSYSYLGKSLIEAYGDDLTGNEISESLIYPHPPSLSQTFRAVTKSAQPVFDESEFTNANNMLVKYRSCVVPLGAYNVTGVGFLLGGMKWKIY